ncbi:hypothetical protein F4806DRAFT_476954 [Annulohypoxylon nitens]|nr:hypothetical protein F4806DRAFT_476954 [Annulohypoxylon nitens]
MSPTFLPFLYYTRTILRTNPRKTVALARSLHATSRQRQKGQDDIPFEFNVGEEAILTTPAESSTEPVRRGTITPTERKIFERIFADIRARGLKPNVPKDSPADLATQETMLIMQQASQDAGQARPATVAAPGLLAGAARDRNKALLRFPPELRAAASKALGTIDASATAFPGEEVDTYTATGKKVEEVDEGWQTPAHSIDRSMELEAKRRPERIRVEGLIMNAKSDFELWDVLEREVFTMPARLGIDRRPRVEAEELVQDEPQAEEKGIEVDEMASESEKAGDAVDSAATSESELAENEVAETVTETEEVAADADDGVYHPFKGLSLYVHGPLYPAYLLLALRRLDTAFSSPSPLVFSLLPRIKELGLESYILGVSTPLYNGLLDLHWTRRGDLVGMLHLLEEMRHCGLYFDEQTASILNQVDSTMAMMASKVSSGSFMRALMTMPEYEKSMRERLRHWHRIVDLSIKEREQDIGY